MHGVHEEGGILVGGRGRRDGELCCSEGLRDGRAAVDTARAGRVPEGAGVCEDILAWRGSALGLYPKAGRGIWVESAYRADVSDRSQLEDVFDVGFGGIGGWGFDQGARV